MSRTFRIDQNFEKNGRDNKSRRSYTFGSKKMKPYSNREGKFTITTSTGNENSYHIVDKVTETAKLVRNNANRSLKKAVRQQLKKEMLEIINEI